MTGSSVLRRPLPLLLAALLAATGCSEDLATSTTCGGSGLCPEQELNVEQVELTPVTEDTTVAGFPLRGNEARLLAARAGDTLDARAIYRFDSLPRFFLNNAGDSVDITQAINPVIEVLVARRAESYVPQATTIEAFDVDVAGNDTSTTELAAAFVPERRLGSATVAVRQSGDTTSADTLRIPLDPATLLGKIGGNRRLRVGLRVAAGQEARVLFSPTAARVVFRAVADTAEDPIVAEPRSETPPNQPQLQIDFSSFTIAVAGTPEPEGPVLAVGGLPGRRSLLRFAIPGSILDSATILRATLVLSQRPVNGYLASDTLLMQPLAVITSDAVRDVRRRMLLASIPTNPFSGQLVLPETPVKVAPGRSGEFELPIGELVSSWRTTGDVGLTPELVLASAQEGYSPLQVHFYSTEAPPELRPRLRLSFVRRIDFNLP